jgi:hypothetical protein
MDLLVHHRSIEGLFSDASQKRPQEERFCEASLTLFDRGLSRIAMSNVQFVPYAGE